MGNISWTKEKIYKDIISKVDSYIKEFEDYIPSKDTKPEFPSIYDFLYKNNVKMSTSHLFQLKDKVDENDKLVNKDLYESIKKLKACQLNFVIKNAIHHRINSTFSIFFLKNNHGYSDKQDINHSGNVNITVRKHKPAKK